MKRDLAAGLATAPAAADDDTTTTASTTTVPWSEMRRQLH